MKTYLTYGFALALGGLLVALLLFFLGFHSEAEKLQAGQAIGTVGNVVIYATCLVLGIKARRAEVPVTEDFGYGRALGTGVMITLFGALFTVVTHWLYISFINPGFTEFMIEIEVAKFEASGMDASQAETAEAWLRTIMQPAFQVLFAFFGTLVFGTVISLIVSAFLKRPAAATPPPL